MQKVYSQNLAGKSYAKIKLVQCIIKGPSTKYKSIKNLSEIKTLRIKQYF